MSDLHQPGIEASLEALWGVTEQHRALLGEAKQLEAQAFSLRTQAEQSYIAQWRDTYRHFKGFAGQGIEGKPFLLSAINFCTFEVPLVHTTQKKYDKDAAEDLFDSLRPDEPIIADQTYGVITSVPRTVVKDLQTGIGVGLAVDVIRVRETGKRQKGAREAELSLERQHRGQIRVGREAVAGYLGSVAYRQTKETFGHIPVYRSNRRELRRALDMARAFNDVCDLGVDVPRIEHQIESKGNSHT